jgi:hypothetical protein
MRIVEVIVSRVWLHKSGRMASVYGACPWTGAPGDTREDWKMVERGFTWEMSNGTIGCGRVPAKTREEAEEIKRVWNAKLDERLSYAKTLRSIEG